MNTAFEQTCNRYLAEIADIDFRRMEVELGITVWKDGAVIPLLGTDYLMECLAMVGMLLADRLKQMLLHK